MLSLNLSHFGENSYCNFGQKKFLILYIRELYYKTTIPRVLFLLHFIEKTQAIDRAHNAIDLRGQN